MKLSERIEDFISRYDTKHLIIGVVVGLMVIIGLIVGVGSLNNGDSPTEVEEVTQESGSAPAPYEAYQDTGVDTAKIENYADTGRESPKGFHIIGDYQSEYNSLDGFLGFYADADERYLVSGVESDLIIVYVDSAGEVHEVNGTSIEDLLAVQQQYQ